MVSQTKSQKSQGPSLQMKDMPQTNGKPNDEMNGLASPTDSDNAEKQLAALESDLSSKLQIETEEVAKDPLLTDAVNSAGANGGDFDSDPLSATAFVSPLHSVNWDAIATRQNSLNGMLNGTSAAASAGSAWESFKRLGPKYPPSLEKLLMDYHHRHSKSWQLVHDLGAGSGVYSPTLAKYFRHVHVSDPNPAGAANSRKLLSAWAAQNKKSRGRFTFSKEQPELGHDAVADGTVDMAIVTEGAHLADAELLVRSAAQSLATNGSLAFVSYSPICRIAGTPRADEAIQRLFTAWGPGAWDTICGGSAQGKKNFALGLDFIPLPDDLFDQSKTRRITINKGNDAFAVPGQAGANAADSRVHTGERRHDYSSEGQDDVARGWRQEVGPEFFRAMTTAVLGAKDAGRFEKEFKEIEKIIHETSPNGIMIGVEWSACVVLATKK